MRQVGLLEHYRRETWPKPNRCSEPLTNKKPEGKINVKLEHLFSVFLLFGAGALISLVSFLLEIITFKIHNRIAH